MGKSLQLHRFMSLGVSCLIHLGLVAGAIALGRDLATWKSSSVVMAELVPAESPRSVATPKSLVTPRPRLLRREELTLPKPIATPIPQPITDPEPVDPPSPPPAAVETKPVETRPEAQPPAVAGPPPSPSAAPGNVAKHPPAVSAPGPFTFDTQFASDPLTTVTSPPAAGPPSVAAAIPSDGFTRTAIPRGGYQVKPSYPSTPRRLGIQGTTTLRIYVTVEGHVTEVSIEQSAGHPDLDHAAADAVRRWRFEPARRGTEAVGMWVLLPVVPVRGAGGPRPFPPGRQPVRLGGLLLVHAVAWRKVLPGSVRDMALAASRDGGRSFSPATLVHADGWKIAACPHRGGSVALDGRGRVYLAWYTEGRDGQPRMLFAVSPDGRRFGAPARLNVTAGSIPDHVRLAADGQGRVAIVWEEATAVRRRVLLRTSTDGGRTLAAPEVLSQAIKAYAPGVAAVPGGGFAVAWHEERFPSIKTIVQTIALSK